jgi:hypothetical protein
MSKFHIAGLLAMSLTLAACSGEPSELEMQQAVEKAVKEQITQQNQLFATLAGKDTANPFGKAAFSGFAKFVKHGCIRASDEPGYVCDFDFSTDKGASTHDKGRFFQANGGLAFEERR